SLRAGLANRANQAGQVPVWTKTPPRLILARSAVRPTYVTRRAFAERKGYRSRIVHPKLSAIESFPPSRNSPCVGSCRKNPLSGRHNEHADRIESSSHADGNPSRAW